MASYLLSILLVFVHLTISAADKSAISPRNGAASAAVGYKPMANETTNTPAVANAPVTPTANAPAAQPTVVPMAEVKVDYKRGDKVHPIKLTRHETQGKGDKAAPVAYWGISAEQFNLPIEKNAAGEIEPTSSDDNAAHQIDMLAELVGWSTIRDMAYAKVNTNLKASQCEQGKDVYTMEQKATYVTDYIQADFGVNSKGGGQAIKALKEMNTKQSSILLQMVQLQQKFATAAPTEAAKILADLQALALEATKLVS